MTLPLNTSPTYTLSLPSTGAEVKFRSFRVKEEKNLLIAQQSEDLVVMIDSLKAVLESCIISGAVVNDMPAFDLQYVFSQVRAHSVGEIVEVGFKCDDCEDEKAFVRVKIDLTKLEVHRPEGHTNKIDLFGDVGVIMKYPKIDLLKKIETLQGSEFEEMFTIVIDSIEAIYDTEEVHYAKDQSRSDLVEFIENLTSEQMKKIQTFFSTQPTLTHKVSFRCPVCEKAHEKEVGGMVNFF
jgi:hypothetical protein